MNKKQTIEFEQFCKYCMYNGIRMSTKEHVCTNLKSNTDIINHKTCPIWQQIIIENKKTQKLKEDLIRQKRSN